MVSQDAAALHFRLDGIRDWKLAGAAVIGAFGMMGVDWNRCRRRMGEKGELWLGEVTAVAFKVFLTTRSVVFGVFTTTTATFITRIIRLANSIKPSPQIEARLGFYFLMNLRFQTAASIIRGQRNFWHKPK